MYVKFAILALFVASAAARAPGAPGSGSHGKGSASGSGSHEKDGDIEKMLQEGFNLGDKDGSGKWEVNEITEMVQSLIELAEDLELNEVLEVFGNTTAEEVALLIVNEFDTNNDTALDFEEWKGLVEYVHDLVHDHSGEGHPPISLEDQFSIVDVNGDGDFSEDEIITVWGQIIEVAEELELEEVLDFIGDQTPEELAQFVLTNFDSDQSGGLDFEEWKAMVTSHPEHERALAAYARTADRGLPFVMRLLRY